MIYMKYQALFVRPDITENLLTGMYRNQIKQTKTLNLRGLTEKLT